MTPEGVFAPEELNTLSISCDNPRQIWAFDHMVYAQQGPVKAFEAARMFPQPLDLHPALCRLLSFAPYSYQTIGRQFAVLDMLHDRLEEVAASIKMAGDSGMTGLIGVINDALVEMQKQLLMARRVAEVGFDQVAKEIKSEGVDKRK